VTRRLLSAYGRFSPMLNQRLARHSIHNPVFRVRDPATKVEAEQ
jgi:hypothetical protein